MNPTAEKFGYPDSVLADYCLSIEQVAGDAAIPGSYWGDSEAGLIGSPLFVRTDTPLHTALHEACHYICMDDSRRESLHTDAAGDVSEENAVCYLQAVLADRIPGYDKHTRFTD